MVIIGSVTRLKELISNKDILFILFAIDLETNNCNEIPTTKSMLAIDNKLFNNPYS